MPMRCARDRILMYQGVHSGYYAPRALHFIPKNECL